MVTSKLIQSRDLMRPTEVELERYVICIYIFYSPDPTTNSETTKLRIQNFPELQSDCFCEKTICKSINVRLVKLVLLKWSKNW